MNNEVICIIAIEVDENYINAILLKRVDNVGMTEKVAILRFYENSRVWRLMVRDLVK